MEAYPDGAIPALAQRAMEPSLSEVARKHAVDSLAFIDSRVSADALIGLAAEGSPVRNHAIWWLKNRNEGEWSFMKLHDTPVEKWLIAKQTDLADI